MKVLGFDVGGTKIEAALIELGTTPEAALGAHGQTSHSPTDSTDLFVTLFNGSKETGLVLGRSRRPTERAKGYEHIVAQMAAVALEVLARAKTSVDELKGMGIGLPGAVHPVKKTMLNGNTLVLINKPLAKDLGEALGYRGPIAMDNDANCFAVAEHYCGAGILCGADLATSPAHLTGIGIILGTGCGGGFVVEGKVMTGARGGAAEVGHTVLYRNGLACYCGIRGCAEQYVSGTAIESHFGGRRYSQVGEGTGFLGSREIFELARNGEPLAVSVIKSYKDDLAHFLAGLCNLINPHYFVLGGGVSLQDSIYEGLEDLVTSRAFLPSAQSFGEPDRIRVFKNVLGDSAGVVGAALLSLTENRKS